MSEQDESTVREVLADLSGSLDLSKPYVSVVLAAGHGKRIKSETSKMLHQIWGVPTVERVSQAARAGTGSDNLIIVVGVKAAQVASAVGRKPGTVFAYQHEQKGTGHAVQVALEALGRRRYAGHVFATHGDVGLLTGQTVKRLVAACDRGDWDMGVLTAMYEGSPETNYYGRIVRIPEHSPDGGGVLGIVEAKEIAKARPDRPWVFRYNGREYQYTRQELFETPEFNAGVYVWRAAALRKFIHSLDTTNVQGEVHLTDILKIFVDNGLRVGAHVAADVSVSLGFNNKTVLRQMEGIARRRVYDRLRDIIAITDEERFFIAEDVVEGIVRMDRKGKPLDIVIGEDAAIHSGVKLNYGVVIGRGAVVEGDVRLGRNVEIGPTAFLSTYPHQTMRIGDDSIIMQGDIVKGAVTIGERARIESHVIVTGSDEFPVEIGPEVEIKGTTYIFGCVIEPKVRIQHSVLLRQRVAAITKRDGRIQPIRYVLPQPQGMDSIEPLNGNG